MEKNALHTTIEFYAKYLLGDIMILFLSLAGGFLGTFYDIFRLVHILDEKLVFGIYTILCLVLSFPILLSGNAIKAGLKKKASRSKVKLDIDKLRLSDGVLAESIWYEYEEHSLTIINDTGHDIKKCYIMLDEVAWENFKGEWEIVAMDVFSQPFKWNKSNVLDEKIDIDNGDRASFVYISHNEYSIYNSTDKQNEVTTDFDFVFFSDEHTHIGYGSDIRLLISIRGKDENGKSFEPIKYLLYVHLKQLHGIPKVDVVRRERIEKENRHRR